MVRDCLTVCIQNVSIFPRWGRMIHKKASQDSLGDLNFQGRSTISTTAGSRCACLCLYCHSRNSPFEPHHVLRCEQKELKKADSASWDDADEAAFIQHLDDELRKIYHFQEQKVSEIWAQLKEKEGTVQELLAVQRRRQEQQSNSEDDEDDGFAHHASSGARDVEEGGNNTNSNHSEQQQQQEHEQEEEEEDALTDTDDDDEDLDARFTDAETDLETLIWETHEIAKYTTLCHTGFTKITKVCMFWLPHSPDQSGLIWLLLSET